MAALSSADPSNGSVIRRHQRRRTLGAEPSQQRERILLATVALVARRGIAATTLTEITSRARVSRRTFSAHFDGLDDVLASVIDEALEDVSAVVRGAFESPGSWRDCLRRCLADILLSFDRRPELARVLLVETLTGSVELLAHRRDAVDRFGALVVERLARSGSQGSPLVAEGALAAVMGVAYSRLIDPQHPSLIELVGPLMGVLTAAASSGEDVEDELRRGEELSRSLRSLAACAPPRTAPGADRLGDVPKQLRDPRSFRARECLICVAANPGSSNRQIGDGIGIVHRGQLSALLTTLHRLGLISKQSGSPGRPNSWSATPEGLRVASTLRGSPDDATWSGSRPRRTS